MHTSAIHTTPAFAAAQPPDDSGAQPATSQPRGFGPAELAFLIAVPLLWAVLLLFHPKGEASSIYQDVHDEVSRTLVVHIGMLLFIPLMALVVYLLLRGVEGTAARVGRIALVPFVIFYSAWETLQGIGNGVLVNEVNGLPAAERGIGADLVQGFAEHPLVRDLGVFAVPGSLGLVVALIAAGIALHRHARAPVAVSALLGVSGFLITAHPPPFGPAGLALFIAAILLLVRSRPGARTLGALGQPESA
jgi:hypothetical protein